MINYPSFVVISSASGYQHMNLMTAFVPHHTFHLKGKLITIIITRITGLPMAANIRTVEIKPIANNKTMEQKIIFEKILKNEI